MTTNSEKIIILDFGSQYTQLIARRIREFKVFSEIVPYTADPAYLSSPSVRGVILSGGPSSVYEAGSPHCDPHIFELGKPILGICYGMQLLAYHGGGKVDPSSEREYGHAELEIHSQDQLFESIGSKEDNTSGKKTTVWMSHGDKVTTLPRGFSPIAASGNSPYAAIANREKRIWGLQFHPEVAHTPQGTDILRNFVLHICGCSDSWTMSSFVDRTVEELRSTVGDKKVLCALSGGVDSSVLAVLLNNAVGKQSTCVFVDNGLLRQDERENVEDFGRKLGINLTVVDARDQFLSKLENIDDPEQKRRIIGEEFVNVFFSSAGQFDFLAQGTLYPDVIESISTKGPSETIKTHHNRVQKIMDLIEQGKVIEPLKDLFKDEVRTVGETLGIPDEIVYRHPFPGPGLAIRLIGPVTEKRLAVLRKADAIVRDEINRAGIHRELWQAFAVLLPVRSVGVMGDMRTYENCCVIRAVQSLDAMTADWARLPYDVLGTMSHRIINEISGINRVMYDISSKPPATIEWE